MVGVYAFSVLTYQRCQTPQLCPNLKFFIPVPSVVSFASTDTLWLLSHNYNWAPRRKGLDVPMDKKYKPFLSHITVMVLCITVG